MDPKTQVKNHTKKGSKGQRKQPRIPPFFARILGRFRGPYRLLDSPLKEGLKMAFRALVLGLFMTIPVAVHAAPLPRSGTIVFSSLCVDRGNTGDLNGDRLVLLRLPLHDMGYLEWSDGSLSSAPLQDLKIDDKSGRISFRYLRDFDDTTGKSNVLKSVSSTITAESVGLVGWNGKPFRLARSWRPEKDLPNCISKKGPDRSGP